MAISLGYFGKVADRSHQRALMIIGGTLLVSFGTLALVFVKLLPVVVFVALVIGVGNAIAIVAATAVVAIDGRELGQGVVMGAFNTAMSIGIVVPPLIFGVILTFWGIDAVFIMAGLVTLASLPFFWWLVLRSRKWFAARGTANKAPQ